MILSQKCLVKLKNSSFLNLILLRSLILKAAQCVLMFTLKVRWIPFLSTNFYIIICGLFSSATPTVEDRMVGWICIMNRKGCVRKWLWPNLWYHRGIWQQVLRELMKILNWDRQWPDWDSEYLPNMSLKHYCLSKLAPCTVDNVNITATDM